MMSKEMERLLATQEKAQQKLHKAQMEEKRIKQKIAEQQRSERTHRLCTRGAYLEKLLIEPELFTDEELFPLLDYIFSTPYAKARLNAVLEAKHQETAKVNKPEMTETEA